MKTLQSACAPPVTYAVSIRINAPGLEPIEQEYAKALKGGIRVRRAVQPDPGASQLRLVALDHASGLAGTARVALPR